MVHAGHIPGRAIGVLCIPPWHTSPESPRAALPRRLSMLSPHLRTSTAVALILLTSPVAFAQSGQEALKLPELTRQRLTEPQVAVRFAPDGSRFAVSGQ